MTIEKRLSLSNIAMLMIPAVLMMAIGLLLVSFFVTRYESQLEGLDGGSVLSLSVQSMIRSFEEEWRAAPDEDGVYSQKIGAHFTTVMERNGYRYQIEWGEGSLKSSLTPADHGLLERYLPISADGPSNSLVLERGGVSVIQYSFLMEGRTVVVTAVNPDITQAGDRMGRKLKILIISCAAVIMLIALCIIWVTNRRLTRKLSASILPPLQELSHGAEEIKKGNLSYEVDYAAPDEFGKVCGEFNEMRLRLRSSIEKQVAYEEGRRELLAGISHDLRTPLTAVKGYAKGLLDGVADTKQKQQRYYRVIYQKAEDMEALTDRLSLLSSLDMGQYPFRFEQVRLYDYLSAFMEARLPEMQSRGLLVQWENVAPKETLVRMDLREMDRVLLNLLGNSIKYMRGKTGRAHLLVQRSGALVTLTLRDDGVGVPEGTQDKLFESFYRADASRSPGGGSGLGLAIARRIITAHGGTIKAVRGIGLTIIITLPVWEENNHE